MINIEHIALWVNAIEKMKRFKITINLAVIGTALLLLNSCNQKDVIFESADQFVQEVMEDVEGVNPETAHEIMDTSSFYMLIDVRESNEYNPGFIPGSINIPRGVLEFNINKEAFWEHMELYQPYKTDLILVYCKKGKRSILAASTLHKMGYNNVKYIEGGFKAWELKYPNEYERNEVQSGHEEAEELGGC